MPSWKPRAGERSRPLPERARAHLPRYPGEVLTSYQVADELSHRQMALRELDVLSLWLYAHTLEHSRTGRHGFTASLPGEAEIAVCCRKCEQRLVLTPRTPPGGGVTTPGD